MLVYIRIISFVQPSLKSLMPGKMYFWNATSDKVATRDLERFISAAHFAVPSRWCGGSTNQPSSGSWLTASVCCATGRHNQDKFTWSHKVPWSMLVPGTGSITATWENFTYFQASEKVKLRSATFQNTMTPCDRAQYLSGPISCPEVVGRYRTFI